LKKEIDKELSELEKEKNKKEGRAYEPEKKEDEKNKGIVEKEIANSDEEKNKDLDDKKIEEIKIEESKENKEEEKGEEVKEKESKEGKNKEEVKKEEEREAKNIKVEEKKEEDEYVSSPLPVNPNFRRPAPGFSSKRPVLDDMKPVSKMMNPIEELKFLNLKNFRRLGDNPEESCKRIFNKIKLLERDGYDKMIKGIKAWHSSEVNQLYVKIGRESILKGKKMREVIVERQKRDLPALKEEEIKAISNLNSRLVF
jgi:hypothetical protein